MNRDKLNAIFYLPWSSMICDELPYRMLDDLQVSQDGAGFHSAEVDRLYRSQVLLDSELDKSFYDLLVVHFLLSAKGFARGVGNYNPIEVCSPLGEQEGPDSGALGALRRVDRSGKIPIMVVVERTIVPDPNSESSTEAADAVKVSLSTLVRK